jgi:transcriptional regulator with XRE-family HTH domain
MPIRIRAIDEALRIWNRASVEIGNELRTARHVRGVTMRELGAAIGVSASEISRRELGKSPRLTGEKLAVHAAAVGLRLSVKLWPVGGGIRDAAQARYVAAFVARVGRSWKVTLEAPIPLAGDLRAVDILLASATARVAVEVITRLTDLQAQVHAAQLKARDIGATRLILVVAATHANRTAIASARAALVDAFELDGRRIIAGLAAGRDPLRDGIVVLEAPSARPRRSTGPSRGSP